MRNSSGRRVPLLGRRLGSAASHPDKRLHYSINMISPSLVPASAASGRGSVTGSRKIISGSGSTRRDAAYADRAATGAATTGGFFAGGVNVAGVLTTGTPLAR